MLIGISKALKFKIEFYLQRKKTWKTYLKIIYNMVIEITWIIYIYKHTVTGQVWQYALCSTLMCEQYSKPFPRWRHLALFVLRPTGLMSLVDQIQY